MKKLSEKLISIIKDFGFSVEREEENIYSFGKISPAGQDFHFCVDTEGDINYFAENIRAKYTDFDVSYETYILLDEYGHGKSGTPYDIKDLYEDMETCGEYIKELYYIVMDYIYKKCY